MFRCRVGPFPTQTFTHTNCGGSRSRRHRRYVYARFQHRQIHLLSFSHPMHISPHTPTCLNITCQVLAGQAHPHRTQTHIYLSRASSMQQGVQWRKWRISNSMKGTHMEDFLRFSFPMRFPHITRIGSRVGSLSSGFLWPTLLRTAVVMDSTFLIVCAEGDADLGPAGGVEHIWRRCHLWTWLGSAGLGS